jgi:DNA polymerase-3 subunit alpha
MKKRKRKPIAWPPVLKELPDFTYEEKLELEKETLGLYLTDHPHRQNLEALRKITTCDLRDVEQEEDGNSVRIVGVIERMNQIITKASQKEMAFITLMDDYTFAIDVVVFPSIYQRYRTLLQLNKLIVLEGKIQWEEEKFSLIAEKIIDPFSCG